MRGKGSAPGQLHAQELTRLLESLPFYVGLLRPDLTHAWVNRVEPSMSLEQVIDRPIKDFLSPSAFQVVKEAIERTFRLGEDSYYEVKGYAEGGAGVETWYSTRVVPVEGPEPRVLVITADISDRKRAEEEARRSEAQVRTVMEQSPDLLVIVDEEFRVTYVNRDPAPDLGRTRESVIGTEILSYMDGGESKKLEQALGRALETGESAALEPFVSKGDPRTWRVRVVGLPKDDDGRGRALVLATDVTAEVRYEQRQRELERQLAESQKLESVGRLAGGVAHDFNNLLMVIRSELQFAREALGRGDRPFDEIDAAVTATERAGELTQHLLSFSRRKPARRSVQPLAELCERVLRLARRVLPENIELAGRWRDDDEVAADIDPGLIESALMNLCVNARDAIAAQGLIELSLRTHDLEAGSPELPPDAPPGPYVCVSLHDDGEGMPPEAQARAFEPFFSTKPLGQGTGLGLSSVHGIVSQHGGFTTLSSVPQEGTTVSLYLPRAEVPQEHRLAPGGPTTGRLEGEPLVLVVEDEVLLRRVFGRMLRRIGCRVEVAADGREALERYEELGDRLALAVVDVVMPRLGGKEVVEHLRGCDPSLPILMVSGYADDALPKGFLAHHRLPLLSKPFDKAELEAHVFESLKHRAVKAGP